MGKPQRNRLLGIMIEVLGWILVVIGLAALVLPGPGLLALFAGVALLATRYDWAERRLQPIRQAALKTAHDSISSWPRITISVLIACVILGFGVAWCVQPPVPSWWPLSDILWLPGGRGTGITLIFSSVIAAAMIVYSFIRFRK